MVQMMSADSTVIIHITHNIVQGGITGDAEPRVEFPPIVDGENPISTEGCVKDWDGWLKIIKRTYSKLGIASKGSKLLLTESILVKETDREKMTALAFDKLELDAFNMTKDAMLVLIANGFSSGTVVYSDRDTTYVAPIYEGFIFKQAVTILPLFHQDLEKRPQTLFDPRQVPTKGADNSEIEIDPIHQITYDSIMKCDESRRPELMSHIVLAGRFTRFPGITKRMQNEMNTVSSRKYKVHIYGQGNPENSVFIGGSLMSTFKHLPALMISRDEYAVYGATFVHKRCW